MKRIQLKPGLPDAPGLEPNCEPLYRRLPRRDADGNYVGDCMILIPGLRNLSGCHVKSRLTLLQGLLGSHEDVVFADLNTPLNLLWVSVRIRHGVINDVFAEIRRRIPEARLVGHTVIDRPPAAGTAPACLEGIRAKISALLGAREIKRKFLR